MPDPKSVPARSRSILAAVFLISFCTLALEIHLLRLFSIREWYHFASMIVSVALFGFSISGTALALLSRPASSVGRLGTVGSIGFAISTLVAVGAGNALRFEPFWGTFGGDDVLVLAAWYLLCGAPFFFSGFCLGAVLAALPERAGPVYGSSLLGSGAGCAAFLLLAPLLRERTPALLGGLALVGAMGFAAAGGARRGIRIALLVGAIGLPFTPVPAAAVSQYKDLSRFRTYRGSEVIATHWDAASRVDVVRSDQVRSAPGRSLKAATPLPPQMGILVDGDHLTPVTELGEGTPSFLGEIPSAIAYRMRKEGDALVLQAGGGLAVLAALHAGARRVVAQESNPIVARVASEDLAEFGGGLFRREDVDLVVEDPRSFLRSGGDSFDVIEISLRDGIYASTAGLSGLGEDYLFTREAFGRMHDRLRLGGLLQVTRWVALPPREPVRLFATAFEAWEASGEDRPKDCLVAFRSVSTFTLIARREPFPPEELETVRRSIDDRGFDLVYAPGIEADEPNRHMKFDRAYFAEAIGAYVDAPDRDAYLRSYPFLVRPATDDRPFYRQFLRWGSLGRLREETGMQWQPLFEASILYGAVLIVAVLLSILFLILPVALIRLRRPRAGAPRVALYFFLIGVGFMFVEVPAIQSSILILGEPAYAFSAVVGSVLIFAGIGSILSGREAIRRSVRPAIVLLAAAIAATALLTPLWRDAVGGPLALRVLVASAAFAPVALLMGIPFPSGVRALQGERSSLIPWAWASNGAASVIGSVLATLLATRWGFQAVMGIGAALYLTATIIGDSHLFISPMESVARPTENKGLAKK